MACDTPRSLRVRCTEPSAWFGRSHTQQVDSPGSETERGMKVPWEDDREFRTQQAAALRAMTDPPLVSDTLLQPHARILWSHATCHAN
jgi:hypothetical protein